MPEFLSQFVSQLQILWSRLQTIQKVIIVASLSVTMVGMGLLITWRSLTEEDSGYQVLFVNIEPADAAQITDVMKEKKVKYKFENDGRTLLVEQGKLAEVRMEMARNGLPKQGSQGYALFDKVQLGMTDFVQNLNYQRALEGEISTSIQTLEAVDKARVHLSIPKPSLFREKKEEPSASIVLKLRPGHEMDERQIRGITHLVASSVEGLVARQVTVVDIHGNLLTKGFADNALAEQADHNLTLQHAVETNLEKKIEDLFDGLLGPSKVRVKVNAELDFEQIEKQTETYTPTSKVVRSQQREDGTIKDSPSVGNEQTENSITNYEIDKTVARIVGAPGTRKRVTVSVAIDGKYRENKDGKSVFVPRTNEEIKKFESLVKNTVGFNEEAGDEVFVASVEFDRNFYEVEEQEIKTMERKERFEHWGKIGVMLVVLLFALLFLRSLVRSLATAMNPPVPQYADIALAPQEDEIPESMRKQNELLERIEIITRDHPASVATLIKSWIKEGQVSDNTGKKKK